MRTLERATIEEFQELLDQVIDVKTPVQLAQIQAKWEAEFAEKLAHAPTEILLKVLDSVGYLAGLFESASQEFCALENDPEAQIIGLNLAAVRGHLPGPVEYNYPLKAFAWRATGEEIRRRRGE